MKVYIKNQLNNLTNHLNDLKSKPVMKYDKDKLIEKITETKLDTNKPLDELNLDFFFDYNIFPNNILIFKTQWNNENRKMEIGDSIIQ